MPSDIQRFETIARQAYRYTDSSSLSAATAHAFEVRNIHPELPDEVQKLFDNGHYAQATFEALKFLDEEVQRISGDQDFGRRLMMRVFGGSPPRLPLNPGQTVSEQDEQQGYQFIFAGVMQGIRNPRGHQTTLVDDPDDCLDYLSLASMLLRKLEAADLR